MIDIFKQWVDNLSQKGKAINVFLIICFSLLIFACTSPVSNISSKSQNPLVEKSAKELIKSQNDQRQYRHIILNNGLKVLMVSDPETDVSAASLDVYTGSGSDPENRQGLAHFLEHMLFLGTKKYPDSDGYLKFIKDNAGENNAFTAFEHTNYFFKVQPSALEPTLDRFAQFFISPLFTETYVEREKNAVHSEYKSGIKEDSRRSLDIFQQIINPQHPFQHFSVGNLETLSSEDKAIREDLILFYKKYYSAKNMALVVVGKESLDELEKIINNQFMAIPSFDVPDKTISTPLFSEGYLPKLINIQPEKQIRNVTLLFPLPDQVKYFRSKPMDLIAHVLGHEGKGSLFAYLKAKNWAEGLSAGESLDFTGGTTFAISVSLTEQGLAEKNAVILAIFQAIKRLQQEGMPRSVFDELAKVSELQFQYKENENPQGYAVGLATTLHYYPTENLLNINYLLDDYQPNLVSALLQKLTLENCLITVTGDKFTPDKSSPYYSAPYQVKEISSELKAKLLSVQVNAAIILPEKNPLLPDKMTLLDSQHSESTPKLITRDAGFELWHKPIETFKIPKSTAYYSFQKEGLHASAKHSVLLDLYISLLNDSFNEWLYPAEMAGLGLSFYVHARGISLKINGFYDKQDELLEMVLEQIKTVQFSPEQFSRKKAEMIRNLENAEKQPPYKILMADWNENMQPLLWGRDEKLKASKEIALKEVNEYAKTYWSGIEIRAMNNGNVSLEQSQLMLNSLKNFIPDLKDSSPILNVLRLADRPIHKIKTMQHADSGYLLYWQAPNNEINTQVRYQLLGKALESSFFNEIRTEQQLGYIVFESYYPIITVPGLVFVVQSPSANVAKIHHSVMDYVQKSQKDLLAINEVDFEEMKLALLQDLQEKPKSLVEESDEYWLDLAYGFEKFDRKQQMIAEVKSVNFVDWQQFIAETYKNNINRMVLFTTQSESLKGFQVENTRKTQSEANPYVFQ